MGSCVGAGGGAIGETTTSRVSAVGVDLGGRRALVTGAASGIGRACAARLTRTGAAVTVLDLDGDAASKVAGEIGGEAVQDDLSDYGVLDSLEVEADIVVNNADLQHVAAIEEFPPERFSLILRVMLETPFRLVRKALPGIYEKAWGRVINISSVRDLVASPYKVAYILAKHGLKGVLQGRGPGRRDQGRDLELHLPGLRAHAASRDAH